MCVFTQCDKRVFFVCVCERARVTDCVCERVRGEAEQECQRRVKLMCQMSEESVRASSLRGSQGVRTPIMLSV